VSGAVRNLLSLVCCILLAHLRFVEAEPFPPGDVNGDHEVDGKDSLLINQALVGLRTTNDAVFAGGFANGDVNGDQRVTGADTMLISQLHMGLRQFIWRTAAATNRVHGILWTESYFHTNGKYAVVTVWDERTQMVYRASVTAKNPLRRLEIVLDTNTIFSITNNAAQPSL
jgi:hypothetical protein